MGLIEGILAVKLVITAAINRNFDKDPCFIRDKISLVNLKGSSCSQFMMPIKMILARNSYRYNFIQIRDQCSFKEVNFKANKV